MSVLLTTNGTRTAAAGGGGGMPPQRAVQPPGDAELARFGLLLSSGPGLRPSTETMRVMLEGALQSNDAAAGVTLFHALAAHGAQPDVGVVNLVLRAHAKLGQWQQMWVALQSAWLGVGIDDVRSRCGLLCVYAYMFAALHKVLTLRSWTSWHMRQGLCWPCSPNCDAAAQSFKISVCLHQAQNGSAHVPLSAWASKSFVFAGVAGNRDRGFGGGNSIDCTARSVAGASASASGHGAPPCAPAVLPRTLRT